MSRGARHNRKHKLLFVTKTLQTELQALIAYACYDSNKIRDSGRTMLKAKLVTKLFHMYMPPIAKHNNQVGMVKLFLSGSRKFKGLFDCVEGEIHNSNLLTIPEQLHNIPGREITISKKCVSLSLLILNKFDQYQT